MYASVHFLRSQPLTFILVQLCVIQGRCGLPHTLLSYVSFPLRVGFFISGLWSASPPSASALGILSASTLQRLGLGNFCSVPHLWIRLGFSSFLTGMSLKSVSDSVLVRPSPPRTCSADLHHVLCADCFASSPRFVCSEECDTNQICLLCISIDTTRAYRVSVKRSINQFLSLFSSPELLEHGDSDPHRFLVPCPALPCLADKVENVSLSFPFCGKALLGPSAATVCKHHHPGLLWVWATCFQGCALTC